MEGFDEYYQSEISGSSKILSCLLVDAGFPGDGLKIPDYIFRSNCVGRQYQKSPRLHRVLIK